MSKSQDNQREAVYLSYLAGIMDGEGTIRIGGSKPTGKEKYQNIKYYAQLSLGNTNKDVMEMFVDKFGANIREDKRVPNRKKMYRWGTSGNITVPKILKQLLPYLVIKKKQAELVIEFCEGYKRSLPKERICRKCEKKKRISGYGLCHNCYMQERRGKTIDRYRKNHTNPSYMPISELLRREELYNKVKKLNS